MKATPGRLAGRRSKGLLLVASLLVALVAVELLLRAGYFLQHRANPPKWQLHDEWGWAATPGLNVVYETPGYGRIEYSTDGNGFRAMGDLETAGQKILAVGDSFTQAYQVSDGFAYYDFIAGTDEGIEAFAYGVGGYATLQESLVLRRYLEEIDPDIVLWQFHPNDLIGSDAELESQSGEDNNHMVRPYLEDGKIVYRHPDRWLGALAVRSVLFRRLAVVRSSIKKRLDPLADKLRPGHPHVERAVATMRSVVGALLAEQPHRTFVAFQVPPRDVKGYETHAFSQICELERLHCVVGLEGALERARADGVKIDGGGDPHWSAAGHETAGRVILDYLAASGLLDEHPSAVLEPGVS